MNKTVNHKIIPIILGLLLFYSCDDILVESVEGNNEVILIERSLSSFEKVICEGSFQVNITIADSSNLSIEAEENLIPFIITQVIGNKLYIKEKEDFQLDNNEPIRIEVSTPVLSGAKLTGSGQMNCDSVSNEFLDLDITGSGKINFSNVTVSDMDLVISGSGDITISGTADKGDFDITGSGSIKSLYLIQQDCEARITGSGNMYLNVAEHLKGIITGSGDIYYVGNPVIEEYITGSGHINRF